MRYKVKTIFKRIILFNLLLLLLPLSAESAANSKIDELDMLLNKSMAAGRFNGNVLIALKGKVFYQKSFGIANIDSKEIN